MKDSNNTSLTIRAKVSSNLNNSLSSLTPSVQTSKFNNSNTNSIKTHNNSNDLEDEFMSDEVNRLIIDLDADIEKSNDRLSSENESHFQSTLTSAISKSPTNLLGFFEQNSSKMSNTISNKTKEINNGANSNQINQTTQSNSSTTATTSNKSISNSLATNNSTNLSTSTVDKGLKMKIQRKNISGKPSESKLEIVQSDAISTSRHNNLNNSNFKIDKNGFNNTNSNSINSSLSANDNEKIKHSSSKNKNSSHREKKTKKDKEKDKEKDKDKDKEKDKEKSNSNLNKNNEFQISSSSNSNDKIILSLDKKNLNTEHSLNNQFNQIKKENENLLDSPPIKKIKNEDIKITQNSSTSINKLKPETRSVSTSTNVSTMTEPECLGFCEPGSTICLEGITWVEAEGVLVVNVTWRGKSYVGTLLDCTRHDWGPPHPRLCDSPTSDLESKGLKSGRGKRARTSISEQDSRLFQSKLRNGKGRRNFQIPASPLKVDQNKRNNRNNINNVNGNSKDNVDNKPASHNSQSNNDNSNTPTPTSLDNTSTTNSPTSKQPNSPVLIECPQPNCSKKYKHINGLKYHQSHCLYSTKPDESSENCKESNIADIDDMEIDNNDNVNSPSSQLNKENSRNENTNNDQQKNINQLDNENETVTKIKGNVGSPSTYTNISDVEENMNENELDKKLVNEIKQEDNSSGVLPKESTINEVNLQNNKDNEIKLNIKEEDKLGEENDQPNKSNVINGVDKNSLNIINNQQPQLIHPPNTTPINSNFPFPYGMMQPNPHYQIPMDPAIQAFLIQQDRFLLDEQQKQAFQVNFNNDFKNQSVHKKPTTSISPHANNRFSPQTQQQTPSSIFNQTNSSSNQLNKPPESSPYDFIHHEAKREELFKISSNKNSLGTLSSPKQISTNAHLLNQQNTCNIKEEQRLTPKQNIKQEENIKPGIELIKPTMETIGGPAPSNHLFYNSISPFLGQQTNVFGPPTFQPPFDPQLLRASNPFQQNFMNRFPGGPQLPISPNLTNAQQQELVNNKLISGLNGNKKPPFEMLQQPPFNIKEMQDKVLNMSPNSSAKNGLPRQSNQLGNLPLRKEDNLSPRLHLGQNHPNIPDPYGALINKANIYK